MRAETAQLPGCLPEGFTLDSMLTVEQFAIWRQMTKRTVLKRLASMPGVVSESREDRRIHPRTYLESRMKTKIRN